MYSVIIADDEQIECRALEHKIHDLLPQLNILPSVYDGLSLLAQVRERKPDIAIVDINMPGMNGLDAIELLKTGAPGLKVIINTSYSDFSFIQRALQLGAGDYLLKPGSREALKRALEKMIAQLDEESEEKAQRESGKALVGRLQRIAQEKWISSLIMGQMDQECMDAVSSEFPQIRGGGYFTAWRLESLQEGPAPGIEEKIQAQISEYLSDFCGTLSGLWREQCYCFLMMRENTETETDSVEDILWHVRERLRKRGILVRVGCSGYKDNPDSYIAGIHEAQAALQASRTGVASFQYGKEKNNRRIPYLFEGMAARILAEAGSEQAEDGEFQAAGRMKDNQLSGCQMNEILLSAQQMHMGLDEFRSQAALFLTQLYQETELLVGEEKAAYMVKTDWKGLRDSHELSQVEDWLLRSVRELYTGLDKTKRETSSYVYKTLIFVHENYQKDISLEEIAGILQISSFYLSRLLRQELNSTFVEILTDIRIRRAIALLDDPSVSGASAAEAVGYTSAAYFYRVFKKTTGITFGQMKECVSGLRG